MPEDRTVEDLENLAVRAAAGDAAALDVLLAP